MVKTIDLKARPLINPLTPEDEIIIDKVIEQHHHLEDLISRCESCGLDMTKHRERHDMHKHVAHKLKEFFFPNQLPPLE